MADADDQSRAAALLASYRDALYEVELPTVRVVIRIGQPIPGPLAHLLTARSDKNAALLSAANPRSCPLGKAENAARHVALLRDLVERGFAHLPAVGREVQGPWRETSALVLGIGTNGASALAEQYGQYAWVSVRAAEPARLQMSDVWPRHWPRPHSG